MKVFCLTHNRMFRSYSSAVNDKSLKNLTISNIIKCCRGEIPSAGKDLQGNKLQWCFFRDFINHKNFPCIESEKRSWVLCLTDGRLFRNNKEAGEFYNIDSVRISIQLSGKRPSAGFNEAGEKLVFMKYNDLVEAMKGESI
ncbi:TPA: hypothetical protein K8M77_000298 [Clostridium perfringens]|nr:hypothetical protein [Clostridium perfringens]